MTAIPTALALAIAAVQTQPAEPRTCAADEAAVLVGARYDDVVGGRRHGPRTIDPREASRILVRIGRHGPVRWLLPGTSATMDWVPARTNLEVGDDGFVLRVRCG